MILGENGEKMSKSRGNVVNPDDIVNEFGADTLRTYEMFIGAFDLSASWSQEGVRGCRRFLDRVWKLQELVTGESGYSKELETKMHQTIKKVSGDYENLKYNTGIAAMMSLINDMYRAGKVTRDEFKTLLILLNPVAPHMTEELWEIMEYGGRLYQTQWPKWDEQKTVESEIEIAVQVNGKVRATVKLPADVSKDDAIAAGKEAVAGQTDGQYREGDIRAADWSTSSANSRRCRLRAYENPQEYKYGEGVSLLGTPSPFYENYSRFFSPQTRDLV